MDTLFAAEETEITDISELPVDAPKNADASLSTHIKKFLVDREENLKRFYSGEAATIRVSEVLGTIAHLYERIRNVVEYKGETVLRRNAIERISRRLLWERSSHDAERIAQILIRELIWARYLPNDTVPRRKTKEVAHIINKYLYFLGKMSQKGHSITVNELRTWAWGVASCEIEETLDPSNREPYVELMNNWFYTQFRWENDHINDHEKKIQIYLAIHRALTKSDDEIMRYHLLLKEFPNWNHADQATVDTFSERFYEIHTEIEKHLQFKDRLALYRMVQRQVAPFEILRELVEKGGPKASELLKSPEVFEARVREICAIRYAQIQRKVRRGTVRSIIYIFITKVIFALLLEVPYELYAYGHLTYIPLGINIILPPALMFLIGLTIHAPGEENTQRIIQKLKSIVYGANQHAPMSFSLARANRGGLANVFAGIYLALFLLVFGFITYILWRLNFTIVGIGIFFAFLSLVLLFGYRVRFTAQELKITSEKEGFFSYLFSNLTLPFLSTGVYLSKGLAKINFFTVILDFLIEAPLKTVIEVVEEWTSFIREKREEVVEVPQE